MVEYKLEKGKDVRELLEEVMEVVGEEGWVEEVYAELSEEQKVDILYILENCIKDNLGYVKYKQRRL